MTTRKTKSIHRFRSYILILTDQNHLYGQIVFVILLNMFAGAVLTGPFWASSFLNNDRLTLFSFFRDTLHSLNVYSEFPWWNPKIQMGFPLYYPSILGWTGLTPLFLLLSGIVWIIGLSGVTIQSYFPLYVCYFGWLVPLLLSLSILTLTRQVCRNARAVYYIMLLTAFSPGVVFSMSDSGIELTAYGVFFIAAFLNFIQRPRQTNFLLMCLTLFILAISLNHIFLYWNIIFVPFFVIIICFGSSGVEQRVANAFRRFRGRHWLAVFSGVILCILPTLIVFSHGDNILRSTTNTRIYSYSKLRPGNPLEVLTLSSPGIGYEWDNYTSSEARFRPLPLAKESGYISYSYMGMLVLPLSCLGFCIGRRKWRYRLYIGIAVFTTVFILSGYSPIFSLVLAWPSPLRAVNHYSDAIFRLGIFVLFLLTAGLGVEVLFRLRSLRRWILLAIFTATSVGSLLILFILQGNRVTENYLFGLISVLFFLYLIALIKLGLARNQRQIKVSFLILMALTMIDISSMAFAHVRLILLHHDGAYIHEPSPNSIGMSKGPGATRAQSLLHLRGLDWKTITRYRSLPYLSLCRPNQDELTASAGNNLVIESSTYNSLRLKVALSKDCRLFWRDAYFPFWKAFVNRREVTVERWMNHFKMVNLPSGNSEVLFHFSPGILPYVIVISYLVIIATAVLWAIIRYLRPQLLVGE